ncbi:MAG: hypothetical protein ACTHK0_04700 [Ginsengibacter sp.]
MKQIPSFRKLLSAIILTGFIFLSSCKKDNNNNNANNPDPALSVDAVQSETNISSEFDDVFNIAMGVQSTDAGEDIGLGTGTGVVYRTANSASTDSASRCFTITVTPKILHQFPKTVTIDFGSGCLGKDKKSRSGKIITIFTGPMTVPGSKATTTFVNYQVDSFSVEGTHTVENTSTSNKTAWTVTVQNGKITNTQNGKWVSWNATRQYMQTEGNGTPLYPLDDVYEITGNSNGNNSNGNSWSTSIIQPIIRKSTCLWRVKGQIQFTRNSNANAAVLDYGDGSCDNQATITINGKTYTITLP